VEIISEAGPLLQGVFEYKDDLFAIDTDREGRGSIISLKTGEEVKKFENNVSPTRVFAFPPTTNKIFWEVELENNKKELWTLSLPRFSLINRFEIPLETFPIFLIPKRDDLFAFVQTADLDGTFLTVRETTNQFKKLLYFREIFHIWSVLVHEDELFAVVEAYDSSMSMLTINLKNFSFSSKFLPGPLYPYFMWMR